MNTFNRNKYAILILLLIPTIIWSLYSFKIHKNMFSGTDSEEKGVEHWSGNKLFAHSGDNIFTAGVCPLGKIGAWFILLWTIFMIIMLYYYYDKYTEKVDIQRINNIFGIINVTIMSIIFILTFIMNRPLFIRTLPFFYLQSVISTIILNSC